MSQSADSAEVNFDRLLSTSDIEVSVDDLVQIKSGYSSDAYQTDDHVVKIIKATYPTWRSADDHLDVLYREQDLIRDYIDPRNIEVAHFSIGRTMEGDHKVLLIQDRVVGLSMSKALSAGADPENLLAYLNDGLSMYGRTRKIPDFACAEKGFNPLIDPNTQVVFDSGEAIPILVDTTFGRTQRKPYLGKFFHVGIAHGVRRTLKKLN